MEMMNFMELAKNRYSMRSFDGRPLTKEVVEQILQAGIVAPTAKNLQPQKVFVLESDEALEKLSQCTSCTFNTRTAFLLCYDKEKSWKRGYDGTDSGFVDVSIVTTHMMLEATALGVGTTWVMWFDAAKTKELFDLPENIIPVCFMVAGYPAEDAAPSHNHGKRKTMEELVEFL